MRDLAQLGNVLPRFQRTAFRLLPDGCGDFFQEDADHFVQHRAGARPSSSERMLSSALGSSSGTSSASAHEPPAGRPAAGPCAAMRVDSSPSTLLGRQPARHHRRQLAPRVGLGQVVVHAGGQAGLGVADQRIGRQRDDGDAAAPSGCLRFPFADRAGWRRSRPSRASGSPSARHVVVLPRCTAFSAPQAVARTISKSQPSDFSMLRATSWLTFRCPPPPTRVQACRCGRPGRRAADGLVFDLRHVPGRAACAQGAVQLH